MNQSPTSPAVLAVACIRASTDEQKDSIDAQRAQLIAAAAYRDLTLAPESIFTDAGVSGAVKFFERPGASAALAHAQSIGARVVLFTKVDRAFRDMADCEFTTAELLDRGFKIHFLDFFGQELDLTTAMGKMILRLAVMVAQFERERIRERITETMASKKARGHVTGNVPYGWAAVPAEDGRKTKHVSGETGAARVAKYGDTAFNLAPVEHEQIILARLVQGDLSAQAGVSVNEAARRLNAAGIPTKTRQGPWHGATVQSVRKSARLATT